MKNVNIYLDRRHWACDSWWFYFQSLKYSSPTPRIEPTDIFLGDDNGTSRGWRHCCNKSLKGVEVRNKENDKIEKNQKLKNRGKIRIKNSISQVHNQLNEKMKIQEM